MLKEFTTNMKIALTLLIVLDAVMILWTPYERLQQYGAANLAVSLLATVITWWVLVLALTRIAVPLSQQDTSSSGFPVWSYFWRLYLARAAAYLVLLISMLLFSMTDTTPSVTKTLLASVITLMLSIPMLWLFYSNDRRNQLQWAVTLVRRMV